MKRFTYTLVFAAMTAALTAPLASCSNDFDAVESVDEFVGEEIKVCSFPAFTTDGSTRAADEKSSWDSNDVIYVQLNGKGEWYALSYSDGKWSAPEGFSMKKTDTYKAVYAPNYELNSAKDALTLKSGKTASTAEYLTCEGTRPIDISFVRNYSRLRLSAAANSTISVSFGEGFTANDGSDIKSFELTTDGDGDSGDAYVYGSWSEKTDVTILYVESGDVSDITFYGDKIDRTISNASVAGKAYNFGVEIGSYVVYNLDKATTAKTKWSDVITLNKKIKVVGTWTDSNALKFDCAANESFGNYYIEEINLSEVKNLVATPQRFCEKNMGVKRLILPISGLTTITQQAFESCASVESIEIPSSVTTIEQYAFVSCYGLVKVVCRATNPPSLSGNAFGNCTKLKALYVPDKSVDRYKDSSWKSVFGENIKPLSELNQ